jgi:hypothetical protein
MAYIFQKLSKQAGKANISQKDVADAREWFRNEASNIKSVNTNRLMQSAFDSPQMSPASIGQMFMFFYDPKTKDSLPYYDRFPLIFPISFYKDGFLGINLHYIPPYTRAKLMDSLYSTINNKKYDSTTKLRISYELLNAAGRFKEFKPCIKRYLFSHVVSNFQYVSPEDWDKAIMLPTERFVGKSKDKVWTDSMSKI